MRTGGELTTRTVLLGLTIAILAVSISIPIYILSNTPESVPVEVVGDRDNDNVPDNEDFYDLGNGGIQIDITHFKGNCGNLFEPCEPKFRLLVDHDLDGSYEHVRERSCGDTNSVERVMSEEFDIPDSATMTKFKIEILDLNSLVGGDPMDYVSGSGDRWGYFEFDLTSGYSVWDEHGEDTPYCSFRVTVSVVEVDS